MTYTPEQVAAAHELPLRKDVRWIDMSCMFPGHIAEATKRKFDEANPGDPATGKFGMVDMKRADIAARLVECHNEWLAAQPGYVPDQEEDDADL